MRYEEWYMCNTGCRGGGQLLMAGTPEEIAQCPESYTARYLKEYLGS